MRGLGGVVTAAVFLLSAAGPARSADDNLTAVDGRPWTAVIPDPDTYNWQSGQNRPGYRYRGMTENTRRFYEYVQAKRAAGTVSWGDRMMIRYLQSARLWPEPPVPNEFWKAYLRYLRAQPTKDLNIASRLMFSQLIARGLLPADPPPDEFNRKVSDYLKSGAFQPRNWFERCFGRVEPWLTYEAAANGLDLGTPSAAPAGVFPAEPFNGLWVHYNVSGGKLGAPADSGGFTNTRKVKGTLTAGGTLTISGTVQAGGFGADIDIGVWAGNKTDSLKAYLKNDGEGRNTKAFSLSVPVTPGIGGSFAIRLSGHYSMGGGYRGVVITGELEADPAAKAANQAAEDAKWRAEVERTLKELGAEETPGGRECAEMRDALHHGDAGWKAYVDRQLAKLGCSQDPDSQQFRQMQTALDQGGAAWNNFARQALGGKLPAAVEAPTDLGGLQVGADAADGQVKGAADHFDRPSRVACAWQYKDLPAGTAMAVVWTRDGQELQHGQQTVSGTGWVSFGLRAVGGNLASGHYVVTITAGGKVVGRKCFSIGAD
jgi:hypothetical protein